MLQNPCYIRNHRHETAEGSCHPWWCRSSGSAAAVIYEFLSTRWHHDVREIGKWPGRVDQGWLNCLVVPGSSRVLRAFRRRLQRLWMRARRRRSRRAHFHWTRLERMTGMRAPVT
ncbi:MAG: hypothetical protein J4G15_02355 [Alphaproteobacteria bacterium]|nr:hypothetical protein [Alphaproteobacteria bacterium]